ncbi:HEPN domain-containing protein [bacterium]|nr:HEPN domain-containing protein [bacterium]
MREVEFLISKAEQTLQTAEYIFGLGDYSSCVSRSYYAMFYMAEAALLTKGLSFSSHKGVIGKFGQHFVRTGIFPKEFGRWLSEAFDSRLKGDYFISVDITREEAEKVLESAKKFVAGVKEYLLKWTSDDRQSAERGN